jgi:hypothetical protein
MAGTAGPTIPWGLHLEWGATVQPFGTTAGTATIYVYQASRQRLGDEFDRLLSDFDRAVERSLPARRRRDPLTHQAVSEPTCGPPIVPHSVVPVALCDARLDPRPAAPRERPADRFARLARPHGRERRPERGTRRLRAVAR